MRSNIEGARLEDVLLIDAKVLVDTRGSSPGLIPNHGITRLTATGTMTIVLGAPEAGSRKIIVKTVSATGVLSITGSATNILFGTATTLTFDGVSELIELVGLSATAWAIVSNQGSVGAS